MKRLTLGCLAVAALLSAGCGRDSSDTFSEVGSAIDGGSEAPAKPTLASRRTEPRMAVKEIHPAPATAPPTPLPVPSLPPARHEPVAPPSVAAPEPTRPSALTAPPTPLVVSPKTRPRARTSSGGGWPVPIMPSLAPDPANMAADLPDLSTPALPAIEPAKLTSEPLPTVRHSSPVRAPASTTSSGVGDETDDDDTDDDDIPGNGLASSAASAVDDDGIAKVKVFYATDRKRAEMGVPELSEVASRFYWPGILAAVTFGLVLVGRAGVRNKVLRGVTVVSLLVTLGWSLWVGYLLIRPPGFYANDRGPLELGTCDVTIPPGHEVGEVEAPSIWRLEFSANAKQHFVLQSVNPMAQDDFYGQVQSRVARSPRKDLFVFVHGFNVSFDTAALRTAQIAYDLNFEGAPIFFSWPSQAGPLKYTIDKENSEWAATDIKEFLQQVAARSQAEQIHLIAHSMGNRALTYALRSLAREIQAPVFNEVVLTAPDVDADIFKRDLAPAIKRTAKRVTLYASNSDQALKLSKQINGHPRAGDSGSGLVVLPGIDTIDVSGVDTSILGHSYYGSSDTVLADLFGLIKDARGPSQRELLSPRDYADGLQYWVFDQTKPAATANLGERSLR